jgi:hypothetical protein
LSAVIAGLVARSVAVHGSRYVILRVVIASAGTVIALLSAEGVTRLVYRNVHSSGNARDYIARHSGGGVERLNSRGFRDREIPPKSPDRYRIVVVGDSFTAGNSIAEEERFSNLIGQFLGPSYKVFNFGRPAANMGEHLRGLEEAMEVSPDFVSIYGPKSSAFLRSLSAARDFCSRVPCDGSTPDGWPRPFRSDGPFRASCWRRSFMPS